MTPIQQILSKYGTALLAILILGGWESGGCRDRLTEEEGIALMGWCDWPIPLSDKKLNSVCRELEPRTQKCWIVTSDRADQCADYFASDLSDSIRGKGYQYLRLNNGTGIIMRIN